MGRSWRYLIRDEALFRIERLLQHEFRVHECSEARNIVIRPLTDANPGYPDQYKFEGWGARGLFPVGVFFFR